MAALALWDYAERSALHIFGRSLGDPLADAVLSALQSADKDGLIRTELHEHFSGHTTARELSRALVTLARLGQVQMVKEAGQGRGRPAERYFFAGQDDELVAGGYLDLAISSLSSRGSAESGSEAGAQFTLYEKEAKKI